MRRVENEGTGVRSSSATGSGPGRSPRPTEAPVLPLASTPGHLVRCAQQVHSALWHEEFGGELTSPQYAVLAALSASPDIDQRTAGELTSLEKSNIADVVARLERRRWVTRVRDVHDARRNLLRLTDEGRTALLRITPDVARVQTTLLAPLPEPDRDRFLRLFAPVAYGGRAAVPAAPSTLTIALQLSTTPGHLLRRTAQVQFALWFAEFGAGVTSPQYAVVSALVNASEPLDQRTAGELASLDKSSIADVVRRLERRGWLRRVRDLHDGRRRLLELTPAAVYAIPQVTAGAQRVQEQLLAPLDPAERPRLIAYLAAVGRLPATLARG